MNYFNKIVKLNLKKFKKSYISLFVVIILACTFTLTITIFNDSLIKTEEQQRKDIYGSWHVSVYNTDDLLYRELLNHGTLKSIGKMTAYGSILGEDNNPAGIIGSADENTIQMGLSFMSGKFPEKENEIAVEMSYLSESGHSYELGQSIPLRIQIHDPQNNNTKIIEKNYILTGVLKNYSSIWKTDGNQLVSFFVTEGSLPAAPVFENIFCTLKNEYVKNADELLSFIAKRGNFIKNDYTFYEYTSPNKTRNEAFLSGFALALIVTFTSVFFIFNIFYISLKNHNKNFVVMRSLGASKNQISLLYCKELMLVLTASFGTGILSGLLTAYLGHYIIRYYITTEFIFYLDIVKLILLMLIIIFFVFIFALCSAFRVWKMPLTGNVALQPESRINVKHNRKLKSLTVRRMVKIFNSAHRKEAVLYFLLSLGVFLVLTSTFYRSYQKYKEYIYIENTYSEDYDYGIISSYFEPKIHITEEEVEKIRKIYGIDYVRTYRCSDYFPVIWDGIENSKYAEFSKNNIFPRFAGDGVYVTVYGLSGDERDYKYYIDEVDEGNITPEDFKNGNEVILYLPTYYSTQDGRILSNMDDIYKLYKPTYDIIEENTIKAGDELVVSGDRGNVTVKIAGIIYDFNIKSSQSYLTKPYSIICNETLYEKVVSGNNKTYEYLQIYANNNANYERTDVEISQIEAISLFTNFRIQKEDAKYNVMISVIISLILCMVVMLITVSVQYNNHLAKLEADNCRNHILYVLGMDKWKIQYIYLYNIVANSIFAMVIGFTAIFLYQAVIYINDYKSLLEANGIFQLGAYVYLVYFTKLPWGFILIFALAYLIMNIIIAFLPKKYRKLKE